MDAVNNPDCKIRPGETRDAEALLEISNSVIAEGKYFIAVSEEMEEKSIEQQRNQIQKILANEKETLFVAEVNNMVVGSIVFRTSDLIRLSHTGSISISISEHYRGMGIGKILLTALLEWAEKHPIIEKVSLGVFATNHRAISLYKSVGFIEEGRKIKEYKISENEYIDDVLMCKFVKE